MTALLLPALQAREGWAFAAVGAALLAVAAAAWVGR
ncbi:MAG: hypothetical protein AVDCRST_MAG59-3806 [uncultured Thermomicrobiales bacterium]|uniref:Uncharacterized protein n=1 Tax=uncultured Thermomicrobiales bacterium TaxID=1645740 RepID=A0A6J4VBB6_9BACT|nr:MAG: hypothetical protein AVDCRST_MAG59-3806 [uncultured Thermomicrobiales bacterium]